MSAYVGAVDLLYYAPHVLRVAVSENDVDAIIANDTDGLASSLGAFLESSSSAYVASAYQLPLTDDAATATSVLARRAFRLHEVHDDIELTHNSSFLPAPAPSEPGQLQTRPLAACFVDGAWLEVVDEVAGLAENFAPGMTLIIQSPASGQTSHVIQEVESRRLLVSEHETLASGTQVNISGILASDPVRMLKVAAFHEWRGTSQGTQTGGDITTFNESLYRMLYTPTDPSLVNMGPEELYMHYIDHPGSVGSLSDLLSAAASADAADRTRIESKLILGPGASVDFGPPMSGSLLGVSSRGRTDAGYSSSVGLAEDQVVPTTSGVREMIQNALPDSESQRIERYLQVQDVLYAGVEYEGVHVPLRLSVSQDVTCGELNSDKVTVASAEVLRGLSCDSADVRHISARYLDVAGKVIAREDGTVEGDTVNAKEIHADQLTLDRGANLGTFTQACLVQAGQIRVDDSVDCRSLTCSDACSYGDMAVAGTVSAGALLVGGMDVGNELQQLRCTVDSLFRRLASA